MENDKRMVELLTDMVVKLDKLDVLVDEVREVKTEVREMKVEIREVKQSLSRQEALFARHLQTTEAQQNTKILELEQRIQAVEKKVA